MSIECPLSSDSPNRQASLRRPTLAFGFSGSPAIRFAMSASGMWQHNYRNDDVDRAE
jgi:hypothetical protein